MISYYHAVRKAATRIANAINYSVQALGEQRVEQEPAMTDRMLAAIELSLSDYSVKGISWAAKTLTDRGRGSQESLYGADFMGVLNINIPDFTVSKGFLAQAKLIRHGSCGDLEVLKLQCELMLELSPDSFVFLYEPNSVRVVPALAVVGANGNALQLYSRSAQRFFEEHLQCFIGDKSINAATPKTLEQLRKRCDARCAFMIGRFRV